MISENKLKHSLGVARKCAEEAKKAELSEDAVKACFVMGLLHDIGYEEVEGRGHSSKSFDYVDSFMLHADVCMNAIEHHGKAQDNPTIFDDILNKADLTIDFDGQEINAMKRIESICERYGDDSSEYMEALFLAGMLEIL